MLLTIIRSYQENGTPGTLFINGTRFCHTLERPKPEWDKEKKGCIPENLDGYQVHLTYSPRFKRLMPLILPVRGFEGVRLHWGNFLKDSDGCPLIGYDKGLDANGNPAVYRSKDCFNELMRWIEEANKSQTICLEIKSWLE